MRRNFAQVLREGKIDIRNEYSKLYDLFYSRDGRDNASIADMVSYDFLEMDFRGTCLTLDEFNKTYGINFVPQPHEFDIDYLVSFCEYVFNFAVCLDGSKFFSSFNQARFIAHILTIIEAIGYTSAKQDGIVIFVPQDNVAIAVSESDLIPDNMSYKVIVYNHHSMKKNLDGKRQILLGLADLLEPRRKDLKAADKLLESDLFFAFNNFNIRHNNIDPTGSKYKKNVADMTEEQLEAWYDEVYQMCLLAFMQLEQAERKKEFDILKSKIESDK